MKTETRHTTNERFPHGKTFSRDRECNAGVWILLIKVLLQCRKAGHGLCRLHRLHEHCVGFMRHDLSFFGCSPRPVHVCVWIACTQHRPPSLLPRYTLHHWSIRLPSYIFCLCLVDLGGQALHTHQHSPAGEAGRPLLHSGVRGDDHTTHLPPRLGEHLVSTWGSY